MTVDSWTAGATVALVVVGITQAALFVWQLVLLRRSVGDTAAAARAATEAAEAARAANRISREAIASEQRPWLVLRTYLNPPLPVSYTAGSDGWRIVLRYEMTNVGKTPARRVSFTTEVVPFMMGYVDATGAHLQTNIANELHDFARRSLNAKTGGGGFNSLLFPGDTRQSIHQINRSDASFAEALESPRYSGQLIVLTCVVYQSTDGSWHETAEAYSLHAGGGDHRIALTSGQFDLTGRTLGWMSHPMADPYAS